MSKRTVLVDSGQERFENEELIASFEKGEKKPSQPGQVPKGGVSKERPKNCRQKLPSQWAEQHMIHFFICFEFRDKYTNIVWGDAKLKTGSIVSAQ